MSRRTKRRRVSISGVSRRAPRLGDAAPAPRRARGRSIAATNATATAMRRGDPTLVVGARTRDRVWQDGPPPWPGTVPRPRHAPRQCRPARRARHPVRLEPPAPRLRAALRERARRRRRRGRRARARCAPRSPTTARTCTRGATPRRWPRCAGWRRRGDAARAAGARGATPTADALAEALLGRARFHAYPDAAPALRALRARGRASSSSPTGTCRCTSALARPGSRRSSTARSPPPSSASPKPDPAIFAACARARRRAEPARRLHVGDSPEADVAGALAAGIAADPRRARRAASGRRCPPACP